MTDEQKAAYAHAQSVAATAEIEGMKAENQHRLSVGSSIAYGEAAFNAVIEKYGIHHNALMALFHH